MDQPRPIETSSSVMLLLLFTAAVTGQYQPSITARVGDEVTLPCDKVVESWGKCASTSWTIRPYYGAQEEELVTLGQIGENLISKTKSDRLSLTADCSLVIKNIRVEDVGRYSCRRDNELGDDTPVYLFVIHLEKDQRSKVTTLHCSVLTNDGCGHIVEWLFEDMKNVVETRQHTCTAKVAFSTVHPDYNSSQLLTCVVTDVQAGADRLVTFGPVFPRDILVEDPTTTTPQDTTTETDQTAGSSVVDYIMLVLRVTGLVLITVITVLLIRARGNQRPPDGSAVSGRPTPNCCCSQVHDDADDVSVTYENDVPSSPLFAGQQRPH